MHSRNELSKVQEESLKALHLEHPELFELRTQFDDAPTLKKVGIELPNKTHYPLGYLKLWPQDFIVEEIDPSGAVYTIEAENLILDGDTVDPSHQTIYATLVKAGISTIEAINDLSTMLGCGADQIQYAGIKDKEAITAQRISFRNIHIDKIRTITSDHFFLKDVTSGKGVMQKSQLKGNRFTILIRTDTDFTDSGKFEIFVENLKRVKQQGFYNFYYLQRFGNSRLNNYLWAISILKGDYKKAVVDMFTDAQDRELGFYKHIRRDIAAHIDDWQYVADLLRKYPLILPNELKVAEYLAAHPEDYAGALNHIPDQVQLWMYALSSYFFNRRLSESALSGKLVPNQLPLFLSHNQADWQPYVSYIKECDIYPPQFNNLKPFPFVQLRSRTVPTIEQPDIHDAKITSEGILLSFTLGKGEYATTFLSHLFNLTSSKIPETMSQTALSPDAFDNEKIKKTLEVFKPILHSKVENLFSQKE